MIKSKDIFTPLSQGEPMLPTAAPGLSLMLLLIVLCLLLVPRESRTGFGGINVVLSIVTFNYLKLPLKLTARIVVFGVVNAVISISLGCFSGKLPVHIAIFSLTFFSGIWFGIRSRHLYESSL